MICILVRVCEYDILSTVSWIKNLIKPKSTKSDEIATKLSVHEESAYVRRLSCLFVDRHTQQSVPLWCIGSFIVKQKRPVRNRTLLSYSSLWYNTTRAHCFFTSFMFVQTQHRCMRIQYLIVKKNNWTFFILRAA